MNNFELIDSVRKAFRKYEELLDLSVEVELFIEANLGKTVWGDAWWEPKRQSYCIRISLNKMRQNPDHVEQTMAHEWAHIKNYVEEKRGGHGRRFHSSLEKIKRMSCQQ